MLLFLWNFHCYREWKTKVDIIDDNNADTVEYDYVNTIYFRPELSASGLTGDEFVVLAHPLILGMAMSIKRERPELLELISNAINGLFRDPKNIFFTGRLFDLLFDGIYLDCSSEGKCPNKIQILSKKKYCLMTSS